MQERRKQHKMVTNKLATLEIENDVPIPKRTRNVVDRWRIFNELGPGQSILIAHSIAKHGTILTNVNRYRQLTGWSFEVRNYPETGSTRVWRVD